MSKREQPPPPPPDTALVPRPPAQLQAPPEVLDGQLVPRSGPSAAPFDAFMAACSPSSKATMRAALQAAVNILAPGSTAETYPWAALDHVAVAHVLDKLTVVDKRTGKLRRASPATLNLTRAALRKMARTLFGLRLLSIDERQRIDDTKPARGKRDARGRALDDKELRKLFHACQRDAASEAHPERRAAGLRDAALLAVLYGGGLRRDEASKLDVGDVDQAAATLRVQGKGGIEKSQPVVPEVLAAVRAWLDVRGELHASAPLFVTINRHGRVGGARLDGKAIAWKVERRARQAGIEPLADGHLLSPHDLRRTFGTGLLDRGEDLATVAKAMRHASIATTAIYDKRDERVVAAAVAKLRIPLGR